MVALPEGGMFLVSEVPLYVHDDVNCREHVPAQPELVLSSDDVQGYLAHKKTPTPLGPT